jgi:hypothetical protein
VPRSIEVIHTPNPEGIVIYDGNGTLDWFNEGKIVSHDSNNPNIIYLKEGDAL